MRWFKHYSNTTMVEPVRLVFSEMGVYGIGVIWLLIERISFFDGRLSLKEAKGLVVCRQFTVRKFMHLLKDFDIFQLEGDYVRVKPEFIAIFDDSNKKNTNGNANDNRNGNANGNANDSTSQGARVIESKDKEIEIKEEEREPSLTPPVSQEPTDGQGEADEQTDGQTESEQQTDGQEEADPLQEFAGEPWHDLAVSMASDERHLGWRQQTEMSLPEWTELREEGAWPLCIGLVCRNAVTVGKENRLLCESHFKSYVNFLLCNATYGPRIRSQLHQRLLERQMIRLPADQQKFYGYMSERCPRLQEWQEPLTFSQYQLLRRQYSGEEIGRLLSKLNNRPLKEDRVSVFATLKEWVEGK